MPRTLTLNRVSYRTPRRGLIPTIYTPEDLHNRNLRFAFEYPEICTYFIERFDPSKEPLLDFLVRQKIRHEQFLAKRGWSKESIEALWAGITSTLIMKRQARQVLTVRRRRKIVRQGNKWVIVEP